MWFDREPAWIERRAVAQCLDRDDSEGINLTLGFKESGEGSADVAVADEGEFHLDLVRRLKPTLRAKARATSDQESLEFDLFDKRIEF